MSFGGPICLWYGAADFGLPRPSLVYPSVYPAKVDNRETKDWRGLRRVFGFRPRPCDGLRSGTLILAHEKMKIS